MKCMVCKKERYDCVPASLQSWLTLEVTASKWVCKRCLFNGVTSELVSGQGFAKVQRLMAAMSSGNKIPFQGLKETIFRLASAKSKISVYEAHASSVRGWNLHGKLATECMNQLVRLFPSCKETEEKKPPLDLLSLGEGWMYNNAFGGVLARHINKSSETRTLILTDGPPFIWLPPKKNKFLGWDGWYSDITRCIISSNYNMGYLYKYYSFPGSEELGEKYAKKPAKLKVEEVELDDFGDNHEDEMPEANFVPEGFVAQIIKNQVKKKQENPKIPVSMLTHDARKWFNDNVAGFIPIEEHHSEDRETLISDGAEFILHTTGKLFAITQNGEIYSSGGYNSFYLIGKTAFALAIPSSSCFRYAMYLSQLPIGWEILGSEGKHLCTHTKADENGWLTHE